MVIEKGTIKAVWIAKSTKRIYSKMFDNIKTAEKFGKTKKDYLIFRLLWHKKYKEYCWEVLPYGDYKIYQAGLKFYQKHKNKKFIIEKLLKM